MTDTSTITIPAIKVHKTARSLLNIEEASHGWNSGHGEAWMGRNCERCSKSSEDGRGCPLENWFYFGGLPTNLNGFGITFTVYEASTVQLGGGGGRSETWHGKWNVVADVPKDCPQRVA